MVVQMTSVGKSPEDYRIIGFHCGIYENEVTTLTKVICYHRTVDADYCRIGGRRNADFLVPAIF